MIEGIETVFERGRDNVKVSKDGITIMIGGKERAKLRSKTYQGIADAMAEQWG